jgi:hypothetical protein
MLSVNPADFVVIAGWATWRFAGGHDILTP